MRARLVPRFAAAYSRWNRGRKATRLLALIERHGVRSILLVGSEDATYPWSNIVERALLGSGAHVVASGLGPRIELPTEAVICDGRSLPFVDDSFDLVVSNAVLEHVGGEADQRRFVAEHHRVGKRFVLTTPNVLFPVESHTRVLGRHWSRSWRREHELQFTRLLGPRTLRRLLPTASRVRGHFWSPTFTVEHECSGACASAG
jgi:hypothetical protein